MTMTGLVKQCAQGVAQRRKHVRLASLEHAPFKVTFGLVLLAAMMHQTRFVYLQHHQQSLSDDLSSA